MEQDISFNKYQLIGKIILQIVLVGILALLIVVTVYPRGGNSQSPWIFPIFGTVFLLMNILILIQILFLPIGVFIDVYHVY